MEKTTGIKADDILGQGDYDYSRVYGSSWRAGTRLSFDSSAPAQNFMQ